MQGQQQSLVFFLSPYTHSHVVTKEDLVVQWVASLPLQQHSPVCDPWTAWDLYRWSWVNILSKLALRTPASLFFPHACLDHLYGFPRDNPKTSRSWYLVIACLQSHGPSDAQNPDCRTVKSGYGRDRGNNENPWCARLNVISRETK